jgi:hypothetical protein
MGFDVTAQKPPSRKTLVEMAVGMLTSRNGGCLPADCAGLNEDGLIERACTIRAHEFLARQFDPDLRPKDENGNPSPS